MQISEYANGIHCYVDLKQVLDKCRYLSMSVAFIVGLILRQVFD